MLLELKNLCSEWKMLSLTALTTGLEMKAPLDHNTAMKGLSYLGRKLPRLSESSFDKDKNRFILRDTEIEPNRQTFFRLTDYKRFTFGWGPEADMEFESLMKQLFSIIQEGFELYPVNVEWLDLRFHATSEWNGNHYAVIREAFLKNSSIDSLFNATRILQNDLYLRGMLDESRVCAVKVESNVSGEEIMNQRYEDDILRAVVGVAQIRGIPVGAKIADVFLEHSTVAMKFIRDKFIPSVAGPLDQAIVKMSQTKMQDGNGGAKQNNN